MGEGILIAPLGGQGVVHVRQGHNLGGNGNLVSQEPVGIAPAVPALVMPAADVVGHLHQRVVLVDGEVFQHFRPGHGVGLHDGEFLVGEAAGLVEDLFVDGDLSNVVQGRGRADHGDVRGGELVALRLLDQVVQHQLRQGADVEDVEAAFAVPELHDVAEDVDEQAAALLVFINLIRHHVGQALLLGVKHDGIDHPAVDDQRVEGPGNKIGDAQLIGPLNVAGAGFGGDHDDGDVLDPMVLGHDLQDAEAVHLRHDDVQENQGNFTPPLLEQAHALQSVLGLDDLILVVQHVGQDGAVELRVVHDQNFLLLFRTQKGSLPCPRVPVRRRRIPLKEGDIKQPCYNMLILPQKIENSKNEPRGTKGKETYLPRHFDTSIIWKQTGVFYK